MNLKILKAVSDGTRFKIINTLKDGELCVCYFPQRLGISQSATSQHFKVLRSAKLVNMRREGTKRLYRLSAKGRSVLEDILTW
jgi:ArsR family transcriptional regulator